MKNDIISSKVCVKGFICISQKPLEASLCQMPLHRPPRGHEFLLEVEIIKKCYYYSILARSSHCNNTGVMTSEEKVLSLKHVMLCGACYLNHSP